MIAMRWLKQVIDWFTRPAPDVQIPITQDGVDRKMERFTQRARRVLYLAVAVAESLHHTQIEPEHMLAGMMQEEGSIGAAVMRNLGADAGQISALVAELNPLRIDDQGVPNLSSSTRLTLEFVVDEARRRGHHYIGTEHLLLGIARLVDQQPGSVPARLFQRANIKIDALRIETDRILRESAEQQAKPPVSHQSSEVPNPTSEISTQTPEIRDQPPQDND